MKMNHIDAKGKISKVDYSAPLLELRKNETVLAKYVRVYLANQRQANAHTKDRGDVSGGGKKPWRQKGTGRARHGSSRSPIWKGGGVTFGPTSERNYKLRINKKEANIALATVIKKRIENDTIYTTGFEEQNKTKEAEAFLKIAKLVGKVMIVTNDAKVRKIFSNLKNVTVKNTKDIAAYDLTKGRTLLFDSRDFESYLNSRAKIGAQANNK